MDLLHAALVAFGVVFVAELGDKSQLLALGFGARHSLRGVALGLTLGYGAAGLIAVVVGGVLGATFPRRPIEIVGGTVFLAFAALALRRGDDHGDGVGEADQPTAVVGVTRTLVTSSIVGSIAVAILVAEMGDKTQIATATLAARSSPVGTWVGATAGEVASGMLGAAAGSMIGDRVDARLIRWASAGLFAGFGILMLAGVG